MAGHHVAHPKVGKMPSNANRAHIAVFTDHYLFRGIIVTGSKRLSDVVNDRITAYMTISNARVYNLQHPDRPVFSATELFLKKYRVEAVAILKEEVNQTPRRLYSFVQKERRPAMVFLRAFEIRGYIHLQGKHETMGPLTREGELFIPVTDARLSSTTHARVRVTAPTILLREESLNGFYIAEEAFLEATDEE